MDVFNDYYEYSGFLKKNILEQNCFDISLFSEYSKKNIFNDINRRAFSEDEQSDPDNPENNNKCIKLNDEIDEIFYTFYVYQNNNKYNKCITLFSGEYGYSASNLSFIPIITEDFNYLTYKVYSYQKAAKVYLTSCNTFPICFLNFNDIKSYNYKEFERFYDIHFITFKKNELESNWSPINKKQHIIFLISDLSKMTTFNDLKIEIYTDKTILEIKDYLDYLNYYYIEKGNTNNFLFSSSDSGIISIQRITGDISINKNELNKDKINNNNNIISYKYDEIGKYINFQIKAEKNSIYNIKPQKIRDENVYHCKLGGNYILKVKDDIYISFSQFLTTHELFLRHYFNIYPIDCNINATYIIKHALADETLLPLKLNNGFYQKIYPIDEDKLKTTSLWIKKRSNKDSCNVLFSYFLLEDNTNQYYLDTGIILDENIPHSFLFNKDYNEVYFYYFHTYINNKITLELNLSKDGNYKLILLINDVEMKDKYYFSSSKSYDLNRNIWENVCNETNHVCRFLFIITYLNEEDSSLKINIKGENTDKNDNNDNNETNVVLIVILVIISLILIAVIIIFIIKCKNKNNNLMNNVKEMEGDTELIQKSKE